MTTLMHKAFAVQAAGLTLAGDLRAAPGERGVAILLHGGGQTRHSWSRTAATLQESGWTALALDARGHGDSGWSSDGDYTMDRLVDDLSCVVDELDTEPVLIGASMGGITSLVAIGEGKVRARGLVLVDVAPRVEASGVSRIHDFMTARRDGFASLDDVVDAIAAYNPHRPRPSNVDGVRKNVRLREDGRWHWHWDPAFLISADEPTRSEHEHRLIAAARNIDVPTLVVRGGKSDVVTAAGTAELLEMVPGSREVVVAGAGHMIAGDDNAVFAASIATFLDEVSSPL
ncbi:alpha/beta fold hydrolase [Rhodococcus sp. 24CO]|uniref:alpha/beta fold hydrolase n=1 Tax=Rhodococcus sp. 24CO TaxID=3117460 RepID=UPI003D34B77D